MRRSPPLVSQYMEGINRSALERHQDIIGKFARGREGVYALYRRKRLYYVGLASDLNRRTGSHLRDRHRDAWDSFSLYLTVGGRHLRELEAVLLRIVSPRGNRNKGRLSRRGDLRPELKREIKAKHRAEEKGIFDWPEDISPPSDQKSAEGRTPILAEYVSKPALLEARVKGRRLTARVRRDGSIRFAGAIYNSPSVAAAKACGRVSCNGWKFWRIERAPGDWVLLDELRV